jgi:hypothetical protein
LYQLGREVSILQRTKKYEEIYISVNSLECTLDQYSMIMYYDSYCVIRMLVVWNYG